MAITFNDNGQVNAPKSFDNKYLKNGVTPYADVADANSTINSAYRSKGLTVLIGNKEYWYRDGILDANLIVKSITSASAPLVIDSLTNNISIGAASNAASGYLTSSDWTIFNGKLGSVATANSIVNTGVSGSPIQLVNDNAAPGNSKYYGTDSGGNKGYFSLPSGTGTVTSIALTVPTGLSVTGSPVTTSGTLAITTSLNGVVKANGSGFSTSAVNLTSEVTGTLPITSGGTGATVANTALNNLLPSQTGNSGKIFSTDGTNTSWITITLGSGTVTSFSSGNLSPLFTTGVSTATTTPALSFTLSSVAPNSIFGNNTGSSGVPSFFNPVLASALFANQGTTTQVLHGNASGNPSWSAVSLTADVSGTLPATNGGTGTATVTTGDILYGSATNTWSKLADIATGNALISGGVTTAPSWGKVGLTTHVSGILPIANGGTATSTPSLVAGTNVSITGSWPNQTVNASGGGSAVVDWINIVDLGADNTGATNVASFINTATATGKPVYFPAGTYLLSTAITLPDNAVLIGDGRRVSTIKLTSNITAFTCGQKNQFKDLEFLGTYGSSGTTAQLGIYADTKAGISIENVGFSFMGGFAITLKNNGLLPFNQFTFGNRIINCYGETNGGGIFLDVRGEYSQVTGCSFTDGGYGIYISGGNNTVTGNNFSTNGYNFYLTGGSNNGHGLATGNTLNHAGAANVYVDGCTLGYSFTNNHIYAGSISLLNCDSIKFIGGDIDVTAVTATNATNCSFDSVDFKSEPTWTTTTSTIHRIDKTNTGLKVIDVLHSNKFLQLGNLDGFASYGGNESGALGTIQQHRFWQTIAGKGDISGDFSRDFIGMSARFDGNSGSPNDMFQIYRTGTTGSAFAVLDNAANYGMRVMPSGRTGLANISSPTAWVHIGAATTTEAAIRLQTSGGTNVSSPNSGDLWWNGTNLNFRTASSTVDLLAGGGSTSPAGSDTQLQYNNSGSFGASSLFVVDTTNKRLKTTASSGSDIGFHAVNTGTGGTDTAAIKLENAADSAVLFLTNSASSLPSTTGFFTSATNGVLLYPGAVDTFRATTNKALFWGSGSAGQIGVRISSPTAQFHVGPGDTSAGSSPIKLTSGTSMTTPEAGAIEYDGSNLYFSPSTTRKRTALTNNATPSNGQLPIGNGTDYTVANLTASDGIIITNGSGSISVESKTRMIFSQTTDVTISNTTTKSTLFGAGQGTNSINIANLGVGAVIKQTGGGRITTAVVPGTVEFDFITPSNSYDYLNLTVPSSISNGHYRYDMDYTIKSISGSGTVNLSGQLFIYNNSSTSSVTVIPIVAHDIAFTTGSLDLQFKWNTADASNVITSYQNTITVFRP
jgi:parallel beta-helix repeat protein